MESYLRAIFYIVVSDIPYCAGSTSTDQQTHYENPCQSTTVCELCFGNELPFTWKAASIIHPLTWETFLSTKNLFTFDTFDVCRTAASNLNLFKTLMLLQNDGVRLVQKTPEAILSWL